MKIAIPTDSPGGLSAQIADQFDLCHSYTLIEATGNSFGKIEIVINDEIGMGRARTSIRDLYSKGVRAVIVATLRPEQIAELNGHDIVILQQQKAHTVEQALKTLTGGEEDAGCASQSCGSSAGCAPDKEACDCTDCEPEVSYKPIAGPIVKDRMVAIAYELSNDKGERLEKNDGIQYLHGGRQIVRGLERALEGHVAGDTLTVTLEPKDAYGEYDESRLLNRPMDKLPKGLTVGAMVRIRTKKGKQVPMTVVSMDEEGAVLDGNHPLAGQTLTFAVTVVGVMAALPKMPAPSTRRHLN